MRCLELHELMSLKLDGRLPADRERLFEAHLDDCPACADEWERWQDVDRLFAGAAMVEPPETLAAQVMMRIQTKAQPIALGRSLLVMVCGLAALTVVLVLPFLLGLCTMGMSAMGSAQALPAVLDVAGGLLGVVRTAAEAVRLFLWALVNSRTAMLAVAYAAVALATLAVWLRVVVFRKVEVMASTDASL